ncbi:MAG: DUF3662 and FHA domain-containing protein [Actinobacteria bacterium]|nr:DUF3662 and FHA domain-containing protein [Actinomycetota bacterium]
MGVAKSIEEKLEGLVEGFFTKVFRSGLQPIEVGRKILREMAENKTVSVNRVYAPNEFRVQMGPDDYSRFSQMEAGLQREFSDIVIQAAKENRWNLMGLPHITFHETEGFGKGKFKVEAALSADPEVDGSSVSTHDPSTADPSMTRAVAVGTAARLGMAEEGATLVVLGGDGNETERISITKAPVTIGRMSSNDVVLSDQNVSRKHAEIRHEGGRWLIVDLGSTNGTSVNGKLAREHSLGGGDRITFGSTELIFETKGA